MTQLPMTRDYFWSRVDRSGGPDACWMWLGTRGTSGYGQTTLNYRRIDVHRLAYIYEVGPITPGMLILHSCDNPPCVNPVHLRMGTQRENMADRSARGRDYNLRKTHCLRGHPFDELNTRRTPLGRSCKQCASIRSRQTYERRKAAVA